MSKERRHAPRIDIQDDLAGSITGVEAMRVTQISRTGAQIDTTASLPVDTLHDLRLTLGTRVVVVKGRVTHSSVRQVHREQVFYRTGIEFIDLAEPVTRAITDFVDALGGRRAGRTTADSDADA